MLPLSLFKVRVYIFGGYPILWKKNILQLSVPGPLMNHRLLIVVCFLLTLSHYPITGRSIPHQKGESTHACDEKVNSRPQLTLGNKDAESAWHLERLLQSTCRLHGCAVSSKTYWTRILV